MVLPLESFQIQGALIRGGSPRAILYALIEASESLTRTGSIAAATGQAQLAIRGVRRVLSDADLDLPSAEWRAWFRSLALVRFNRARLIFPPTAAHPQEFLRLASELADQYAIDLSIQPAPSALDAVPELLRISSTIRAIHATSGQAAAAATASLAAGRYVVVETAPGISMEAGIPARILAPWKPGAPRPCPPGCEFLWLMDEDSAPVPALLTSGAAGFEVDHARIAAWSGFGYAVKAASPAKKTPVRKKTTTKKPSTVKKTTTRKR
jgi:hypothetical protein